MHRNIPETKGEKKTLIKLLGKYHSGRGESMWKKVNARGSAEDGGCRILNVESSEAMLGEYLPSVV